MADKKDGDLAALGQKHEPARRLAHLADTAGGGCDPAEKDGLDGVDHGHHRPRFFQLLDDGVEVVFRHDQQAIARDAEPLRTQLELLDGFLAGNVENRAERRGDLAGQLQEQR